MFLTRRPSSTERGDVRLVVQGTVLCKDWNVSTSSSAPYLPGTLELAVIDRHLGDAQ